MLKIVQYVSEYCDHCEGESAYMECIGDCGKVFCRGCQEAGVVRELPYNIYNSCGHTICQDCEAKYRKTGGTPLYKALMAVQALKHELEGFYASFNPRKEAAESDSERLHREVRERSTRRRERTNQNGVKIIGPYLEKKK
jgi:hypothetical protein